MTRLHLCVCALLCVLLCLDTTEGEKTSKLSKVKGVISSFKKPSSSGPATSSAGTYKEKIKKLNTKENKDKTKKAAKKLKTKSDKCRLFILQCMKLDAAIVFGH